MHLSVPSEQMEGVRLHLFLELGQAWGLSRGWDPVLCETFSLPHLFSVSNQCLDLTTRTRLQCTMNFCLHRVLLPEHLCKNTSVRSALAFLPVPPVNIISTDIVASGPPLMQQQPAAREVGARIAFSVLPWWIGNRSHPGTWTGWRKVSAGAHTTIRKWSNSTYQIHTPVNVLSGTAVVVGIMQTVLKSFPGRPTHRNQHCLLRGQTMSCACMDCASSSSAPRNQPCFLGRRQDFSSPDNTEKALLALLVAPAALRAPSGTLWRQVPSQQVLPPVWQHALSWILWSV